MAAQILGHSNVFRETIMGKGLLTAMTLCLCHVHGRLWVGQDKKWELKLVDIVVVVLLS